MKIIAKYYDKLGKLRILKNNKKSNSAIRFKSLKDEKKFPCCDFDGKCTNKAYTEVYLFMMKNQNKKGWSYLCKKHYLAEQKRLNSKLPSCLQVEW